MFKNIEKTDVLYYISRAFLGAISMFISIARSVNQIEFHFVRFQFLNTFVNNLQTYIPDPIIKL